MIGTSLLPWVRKWWMLLILCRCPTSVRHDDGGTANSFAIVGKRAQPEHPELSGLTVALKTPLSVQSSPSRLHDSVLAYVTVACGFDESLPQQSREVGERLVSALTQILVPMGKFSRDALFCIQFGILPRAAADFTIRIAEIIALLNADSADIAAAKLRQLAELSGRHGNWQHFQEAIDLVNRICADVDSVHLVAHWSSTARNDVGEFTSSEKRDVQHWCEADSPGFVGVLSSVRSVVDAALELYLKCAFIADTASYVWQTCPTMVVPRVHVNVHRLSGSLTRLPSSQDFDADWSYFERRATEYRLDLDEVAHIPWARVTEAFRSARQFLGELQREIVSHALSGTGLVQRLYVFMKRLHHYRRVDIAFAKVYSCVVLACMDHGEHDCASDKVAFQPLDAVASGLALLSQDFWEACKPLRQHGRSEMKHSKIDLSTSVPDAAAKWGEGPLQNNVSDWSNTFASLAANSPIHVADALPFEGVQASDLPNTLAWSSLASKSSIHAADALPFEGVLAKSEGNGEMVTTAAVARTRRFRAPEGSRKARRKIDKHTPSGKGQSG